MRADRLALWNGWIIATIAVTLALYPEYGISFLRIEDPSFPVLALARSLGIMSFMFAAVVWSIREWLGTSAARPTRRALASAYAVGALLLLPQQIAIWSNGPGLAAFLGFAILAICYWRATDAPAAATHTPAATLIPH